MYGKRTILYTTAKHGQKKDDTQTLNMDRNTTIHKHETWKEKVPNTNTKHGKRGTIHKH